MKSSNLYMGPKLYWINSDGAGRLAISARPRGGDWLEDEIEGWRREGVNVVVSLLTREEMQEMSLDEEPAETKKHSMRYVSLAIPDRSVPPDASAAAALIENIQKELTVGRTVAIHCRQGIGRSGMIAAALLVRQGSSPSDAIQRIGDSRGLPVPETEEQRAWVFDFSPVPTAPSKGSSRR